MGLAGAAALTAFSALSPNAFAAQVIQPGGGTSGYGYIVAVNTVYTQFGGVVGEFAIYGSDKFMAYQYPGTQIYPGWSSFFNEKLYSALVSAADEISGATLSNDIVQSDIVSDNSLNGNGYLGLPYTEVSSVASELGGNAQYVMNQVTPYEYSLYDTDGGVPQQTLVPFALVVNESGAEMDPSGSHVTPTGNYYGNDPIEHSTFYVIPSKPPTAQSLTAQVQGTTVNLSFTVNVPLWNTLANYHYDAVEITNADTGQTQWLAGYGYQEGSGSLSQMQAEPGTQGTFTDTFQAEYLSPGHYTAAAWVADGVDRVSGPVTTTFTIQGTPGTGGGGGGGGSYAITLTASNTAPTVGQSVTLTAQANGLSNSGLPNGDSYWIVINDQKDAGTLQGGSNQYQGGYDASTASTSAVSNHPLTDTYVADLIDGATGQIVGTSNSVQVTWSSPSSPSPPPAPPPSSSSPQTLQLTLSANPTKLPVGQATTLTVTVTNPNASYYPGSYYLAIFNDTTGQDVLPGYVDLLTVNPPPNGSQVIDTITVTENSPQSDEFIATLYSPQRGLAPGEPITGSPVPYVSSNTVTVTWQSGIVVTLTASPTTLTVGQATTLTATVEGDTSPKTTTISIIDTTTGQGIGTSASGELSYTVQYASQEAGTDDFVAIVTAYTSSDDYLSNTVSVTWTTAGQCSDASWTVGNVSSNSAGLTFTHNDNDTYAFTVNNGGSLSVPGVGGSEQTVGVILTGQPGESYTVTATDTTTNCTTSTTVTLASNGGAPIQTGSVGAIVSDQYTQLMGGGSGIYAAGPNVTVDAGTSVNFNVQFVQTGQPAIYYSDFEAPNNGNLPAATNTGWSVEIVSSGGTNGAALNQSFTNGSASGSASVSTSTPQTVTYTASLIDPNGVTQASETFQITWAGATVSASPTQLPVGQTSTITVNAYAPGRTVTLYSSAPVIQGEQEAESCGGKGCRPNGNYEITVNSTGTTTLQAVSNTAQVVRFWVTTTPPNPPSPTDVGTGTQSPAITVAWGSNTGVSITLTATPGSTTYGGTITESYNVQGWQSGDEVIIQVVNESPPTPVNANNGTYFPNAWYTTGYTTPEGWVFQAVLTQPTGSHNEAEQPVTLSVGMGGTVNDQGDTLTITYQAEVLNADGQLLAVSNEITPTWTPTQTPPPAPDCGAPYDSDEQWTSYGNGSEELTWVYNVPTPEYNAQTNSWQCVDVTTQESQYYPASVNDGQISGLSYDPGTPEDMWLPVPAGEWDSEQCPGLFCQYFQEHGFTGLEGGGPTANQISSTRDINGQTYHTYGPPIGDQTPTVWVRPDAGFGFRYVWQGPPNSLPTGGTVKFTMTNPDGGSITWTEPLTVNSDTLYDVGDTPSGTQAPEIASEVVSCWTNVPKVVYLAGKPELTAWSISSNPTVAYEDGAHISFTMTVDTPAGNITVTANNVACTFGWPAYWFTHIISESIGGKTY